MPATRPRGFVSVAATAALSWACGAEPTPAQPTIEWVTVPWEEGTLNVALVRPSETSTGPHPVIFALPWGSGSSELVASFVRSYWISEPGLRGYYVVSPEVLGSSLADTADEVIPAIFAWMEGELDFDADRVALVGASNGGRGMFFAALSQPARFQAMMGLPGQFSGPEEELAVLADKPIWLLVGEHDTSWVTGSEATRAALASQGIEARFDIVAGQDHVMTLDPSMLLDWIDEAVGR